MIQEYLGDGLYVEFDGYQYRLFAPRPGGVHEVFLDSFILDKFNEFAKRVRNPMVENALPR